MKKPGAGTAGRGRIARKLRNDALYYVMLVPVLAWYAIFCYVPMAGITLAFRNFRFDGGLWNSPWVGMDNFVKMMSDAQFLVAVKNTVIIGVGGILFQMPCAIILAILINEIRGRRAKKFFQTVVTFPHFISWMVLGGILTSMFSSSGIINQVLGAIGLPSVSPLTSVDSFRPFIWISNIWKEIGWDSIIYIAAITSIDTGLYEAAEVDGASRLQKMWHITLPGIRSTIVIMLILAVGQLMNNGRFDQIFNLYSAPVYSVGDTLDTYIFRESFVTGGLNFGYSTAIGLFKSVIGVVLISISNKIASRADEGLF
ncbi:ABC transporter permease [Anaeromassilibacillus sp. An200]|uniref:ABC transporter permease n=1 Tax=Anaeromassilibacillus sp. An200 TaxID=1965587 RepID=UPI000B39EB07|nr:ABC transporter permease subunit [Anaeromassilibacillus sp. An200]OUP06125.1 protein lplB [Anaeromassilibacillus sp. An200]